MAYGDDEEALAADEKVAMEILVKEFDWYTHVRQYMEKTFKWYELDEDDRRLLLVDAMYALVKPCDILVHLMDSVEIHHKDFSNHKSLINEQRANFYNDFLEISHKAFDPALKDYLASFHTTNSLPFPDSDSKEDEDGETSPQSENSNITSKTGPEMITRKRKRSPDEAEEQEESVGSGVIHPPLPQPAEMITKNKKRSPDEAEEEEEESVGSGYTYIPPPPVFFEDGYFLEDYDMYHDHSKCDLNYSFDDDNDDNYFDI